MCSIVNQMKPMKNTTLISRAAVALAALSALIPVQSGLAAETYDYLACTNSTSQGTLWTNTLVGFGWSLNPSGTGGTLSYPTNNGIYVLVGSGTNLITDLGAGGVGAFTELRVPDSTGTVSPVVFVATRSSWVPPP